MKVRVGRFYRNRAGVRVGPVDLNPNGMHQYPFRIGTKTYSVDGKYMVTNETPDDLVVESSAAKPICDVTLEDYRRGVASVMRRI